MKTLGLILLAVLVCGCGAQAESTAMRDVARYDHGGHHIIEFKLSDGTRCVSHYQGGIACEWKK